MPQPRTQIEGVLLYQLTIWISLSSRLCHGVGQGSAFPSFQLMAARNSSEITAQSDCPGCPGGCEPCVQRTARYECQGADSLMLLHIAALKDDRVACASLLAAGAHASAVETEGSTSLHSAASRGHPGECKPLLAAGTNADAVDAYGCKPLYDSACGAYRYLEVCHALIAATGSVNVAPIGMRGRTPLYVAAARGRCEVCIALLTSRANVNAVDTDGTSALLCAASETTHFAADRGYGDVCATLLAGGANLNSINHDERFNQS